MGAIRFILILGAIGLLALPDLTNAEGADLSRYLPESTSFEAQYVVIERDPELDPHNQRVQKAIREQPDWWNDYIQQHQGKDPIPWHANFGVSEKAYYHFQSAINHFREASRQTVRISRSDNSGMIQLTIEGSGLLVDQLSFDPQGAAVTTQRGKAVFRSNVDLDRASLPPGKHQGVLFNTPREEIIATRSRESVFIGRLKESGSGIIHYGFNSEAGQDRAYIVYDLD